MTSMQQPTFTVQQGPSPEMVELLNSLVSWVHTSLEAGHSRDAVLSAMGTVMVRGCVQWGAPRANVLAMAHSLVVFYDHQLANSLEQAVPAGNA